MCLPPWWCYTLPMPHHDSARQEPPPRERSGQEHALFRSGDLLAIDAWFLFELYVPYCTVIETLQPVSAEELRALAHRNAALAETASQMVAALAQRGWTTTGGTEDNGERDRLLAIEKVAPAGEAHADLLALPEHLRSSRLAGHVVCARPGAEPVNLNDPVEVVHLPEGFQIVGLG